MDVNRGAIIARPTQLFVDWLNKCEGADDQTSLSDAREECTTYLVPSWEDDHELERVLKRNYRRIFEAELEGWIVDESMWPVARGYGTFRKWFDIEVCSVVVELGDGHIEVGRLDV